jgi:VCBS repeat-containing protein
VAVLESGPAHGTLTLNSNGSFSYEPDEDYNGEDSFTYKADDDDVEGNVATVRISVGAVNDAPRITGEKPASKAIITDRTPKISATVKDPETALARSDIKLYLDGRLLETYSYDPATGLLSRETEHGLDYHNHRVKIVATDAQGLVTTKEWTFEVKKRR